MNTGPISISKTTLRYDQNTLLWSQESKTDNRGKHDCTADIDKGMRNYSFVLTMSGQMPRSVNGMSSWGTIRPHTLQHSTEWSTEVIIFATKLDGSGIHCILWTKIIIKNNLKKRKWKQHRLHIWVGKGAMVGHTAMTFNPTLAHWCFKVNTLWAALFLSSPCNISKEKF